MLDPADADKQLKEQDPEAWKSMQPPSFMEALKRGGMVPPDMMGPEYSEESIRSEYEDASGENI